MNFLKIIRLLHIENSIFVDNPASLSLVELKNYFKFFVSLVLAADLKGANENERNIFSVVSRTFFFFKK